MYNMAQFTFLSNLCICVNKEKETNDRWRNLCAYGTIYIMFNKGYCFRQE